MVLSLNDMRSFAIGGVGAFLCILGTTFFFTWPSIIRTIIHKQLQITSGSESFRLWRDTPIPMHMNFYLYNWTNYEEVETEKPNLVEMGPYRFNMEEKKTDITMNTNGTVTFQIRRVWYFDSENSKGSLDDDVTTLNPVAMSAAFTGRNWATLMKMSLGLGLKTNDVTVQVTAKVGDILFEGYEDPLIDMASKLPSFAGVNIPFDKFAWFYNRNGSSDNEGVFTMETGENGIEKIGVLQRWNYEETTGFYPDSCGLIKGSAGELFPPQQTKQNKVELYSADLCRSVALSFKKEEEIHGITGYKYTGDEYTFDNGTLDPSNKCYCEGDCGPSGVLNVTACRYGTPGFVSFPHFLLADDYYRNSVNGIHPEFEKHNLYITLEPETGIPLDVAARFQINLLMTQYDYVGAFKSLPTVVFPMLWFEQRATISPELASMVKLALYAPLIGQTFSLILTLIGCSMIAYAVQIAKKERKKLKFQKNVVNLMPIKDPLLQKSEDNGRIERRTQDSPKVRIIPLKDPLVTSRDSDPTESSEFKTYFGYNSS